MKQTINRISNRVGDWFATLFSLAALLLVFFLLGEFIALGNNLRHHALELVHLDRLQQIADRLGGHHWIPIQWLALHVLLIILTLCVALAAYIIADRTTTEPPETY